jgi:peptidoglycan/LPS O-acetylase OafA/YrhL
MRDRPEIAIVTEVFGEPVSGHSVTSIAAGAYALGSIVLTLGISSLTYRWIEVPGRDWSKNFSDQVYPKLAPAAE